MENDSTPLVSPMDSSSEAAPTSKSNLFIIVGILIILAGGITGFFLAKPNSSVSDTSVAAGKDVVKTANEIGSTDTKTFKDQATGTIEKGGLNGEGTHKLIREGGPSQTVYLISSVIDLDELVGKKVEVFGQTLKAQKVGWLMDVGRVKIVE